MTLRPPAVLHAVANHDLYARRPTFRYPPTPTTES